MNSFYADEELNQLGLKHYGTNVLISRKASIYVAGNISIGSNVRIDDFCILSGSIEIGNYVHIAAYCGLFGGQAGIELMNYSTLSSRCAVYAISDDYSGAAMTNPTVPIELRNVSSGKVLLEKHVIVGTGSSIMPSVTIGEGTAVGSMSLVVKSLDSWGIYVGSPCRRVKDRSKKLLDLEAMISSI